MSSLIVLLSLEIYGRGRSARRSDAKQLVSSRQDPRVVCVTASSGILLMLGEPLAEL